ncbi:hypothetical protein M422DRAFT_96438, partial [Sphaerobolus stellatus SS14]
LFRLKTFQDCLVAFMVDKSHVIYLWGLNEFRRAYGDLQTLKLIVGAEIPWRGLTTTMPTHIFEAVYSSVGMGTHPFWGLDMGSDHPNIRQWVRP